MQIQTMQKEQGNYNVMLKVKLDPDNKAWWGTQSQLNLYQTEKWRKPNGKNSTPKRDSKKRRKERLTIETPQGQLPSPKAYNIAKDTTGMKKV